MAHPIRTPGDETTVTVRAPMLLHGRLYVGLAVWEHVRPATRGKEQGPDEQDFGSGSRRPPPMAWL
ncbi:hypothetical protein [Streptomyces coelicoflavus]|uniref:hypothetical protein n=1 Tax=Streptomyces coelicoflavus TaxID=285562 RepID=UPI003686F794